MLIGLRIERPFLSATLGIEGDHAIERGGQIHRAVDDNRRRLEFAFAAVVAAVGDIASVVFPGNLQLRDIAPVDLS